MSFYKYVVPCVAVTVRALDDYLQLSVLPYLIKWLCWRTLYNIILILWNVFHAPMHTGMDKIPYKPARTVCWLTLRNYFAMHGTKTWSAKMYSLYVVFGWSVFAGDWLKQRDNSVQTRANLRQLLCPGMREEVQVLNISPKRAAAYSFPPSQHDANINLDATCYVPKSTAVLQQAKS